MRQRTDLFATKRNTLNSTRESECRRSACAPTRSVDHIEDFLDQLNRKSKMNKFKSYSSARPWFMALLLSVLAVGCGGGGGGRDPILGTDGAGIIFVPPQGANVIIPGAACPVASATIPTVIASDPTSGNQFATTSTNGVVGGGKLITATFSLAMDPRNDQPNKLYAGASGRRCTGTGVGEL
ncbi:hypothetical protein LP417_21040 [Polaromonas sp. P1-6]|nr:hypothetical protein LP417_21040 [Polaromonas sp. P1-6]